MLVARVAVRGPRLVDVDVFAVAICGKELDLEFGEERVHSRLVRGDPLAAELVRLAAELRVPQASPHAVPRLEDDHVTTLGDELPRSRETGDAGADHHNVGLDQAGVHASLRSAAAAAARPVRTAPSMYPATH